MNGLVKRSDVIETANKFSFTDENDRRRYLDFLGYCLKETKTAYDVDAVVKQVHDELFTYDIPDDIVDDIVRKGGVNENNN